MKRIIFAFVLLSIGVVSFNRPQTKEVKLTEESSRSLPSQEIFKKWRAVEVQEKKETEKPLSVVESQKAFQQQMKKFKKVAAKYNQKALKGEITEADEQAYQVSMKASDRSFEQYQNAVLSELGVTKDI